MIHGRKQPVAISDIARRQKVPKVYIKRILSELTKARLLKSKKGARGGFVLNKKPRYISLLHLYQVFPPYPAKKDDFKKVKNKRVRNLLERTRESLDQQTVVMLKSIKLNAIFPVPKRK